MMYKEKNFVSVVIYVHNAEKRIVSFLSSIIELFEDNFEHSEIICVNDLSEDNSLSIIKEVSKKAVATSVSVVNMSCFHGLERAMNAGVDLAIGDFVFEFDNTFMDYEPKKVMEIYKHSLKGFDIVSASPDRKERFTSKIFYKIFNHYSDYKYEMSTESFRILSRRAINRISSMNKTVPYRKAIYTNCGLKIDNIKYRTLEGKNHILGEKEKEYRIGLAVDSLILFTKMGYKFSKMMTLMMMVVSLGVLLYSIIVYTTSNPVTGWTTTILFLSIAFLGLFGILTVIVKYLQLLVELVFKKKHYNFENIEKLTK